MQDSLVNNWQEVQQTRIRYCNVDQFVRFGGARLSTRFFSNWSDPVNCILEREQAAHRGAIQDSGSKAYCLD